MNGKNLSRGLCVLYSNILSHFNFIFADLYAFTTPERPAGDRLFVDGDTGDIDWNEIARNIIEDFEANDPQIKYEEYSKAKNVILFVGAGMGPSTVSAARIYSMQSDQTRLTFDSFPNLGISRVVIICFYKDILRHTLKKFIYIRPRCHF